MHRSLALGFVNQEDERRRFGCNLSQATNSQEEGEADNEAGRRPKKHNKLGKFETFFRLRLGCVDWMSQALFEEEMHASSCCLLELAADNDLEGFQMLVEKGNCKVDVVGPWYVRRNGSRQMVLEQRTPAMIAALYGSLDVLKYIVKHYCLFEGDIDQRYGHDGSTALHCAAAGSSEFAVEAARILLESGADVNVLDSFGRRPCDVIDVPHSRDHIKKGLIDVLNKTKLAETCGRAGYEFSDYFENYLPLSSSDEKGLSAEDAESAEVISSLAFSSTSLGSGLSSLSSPSPSSSPKSPQAMAAKVGGDGVEKVREYPVDPSLPDIKNSIYTTDEFRMYSFKIRPCSRAYSHDWTECPFVHPGENARRRDPRRYHYSCVPCPEFRKGSCRRGDTCEYAHGVFECWLHPAQYRTRLCKDGTSCTRRVCFFAHTAEELRPLYVSTGSGVPSPRSSAFDMSLMSPPLAPGSPSVLPSYSPSHSAQSTMHGTPPMSPSSSAPSSFPGTRAHPSIPSLHLPGASLQSSRLRAALLARNTSVADSMALPDFERQSLNDFQSLSSQSLSTQARLNAAVAASSGSSITSLNAGQYRTLGINVAPANLEELFASEKFSSPKSAMHHDPSIVSQFEAQLQAQGHVPFSPVSTRTQQLHAQQAALEAHLRSPTKAPTFSLGSLSRMSLLGGLDEEGHIPEEAPISLALAAARAAFAQRDKRSHSSRDLGANFTRSEWGSPTGKLEWSVQGNDLSKLRKSSSFGVRGTEEPDLSWVQKLVKEVPSDACPRNVFYDDAAANAQRESAEISLLGSWIDKLSLEQVDS
ncbi:hypothetical protein GOP47_0027327 [Adiantum capillus-veneris]|nr:hypothetical protein GOP47_0027327 [Adiantum capillus-veneris]